MATLRDWKAGQPTSGLGLFRMIVGLAQGGALYALYYAMDKQLWPSQNMSIFLPLVLVGIFVPGLLLVGAGTIRPRTLGLWVVMASASIAALGYYAIWRTGDLLKGNPSAPFIVALVGGLFLAHTFVAGASGTGRLIAPYTNYFDAAWKQFIQLVLSGLFAVVLWIFLHLGGDLFHLIGIDRLREILDKEWFFIPVTALAVALAIHVSDVRAGIVNGIRALLHTLLAWLLPVMALLSFGFLASLPFTGLAPLWETRSATSLLLCVAAVLVVLINAVYQDGKQASAPPKILRVTASASGLALMALVGLSGYALGLRVLQYGLTPDRIIASACLLLAGLFALGYGLSILWRTRWMRWLEATNIAAAGLVIALLLALFSPLCDPARLSVWDQTRRLEAGDTPLDKFDFKFLRFESERFGQAALEHLKASGNADIAARAKETGALENQYASVPLTPQMRAKNITVLPAGAALPADLLATDWSKSENSYNLPACLTQIQPCEARLIDLDNDAEKEVLIWGPSADPVVVLDKEKGVWRSVGQFYFSYCEKGLERLRAGDIKAAAPRLKEIEILGHQIHIDPQNYDTPSSDECAVHAP